MACVASAPRLPSTAIRRNQRRPIVRGPLWTWSWTVALCTSCVAKPTDSSATDDARSVRPPRRVPGPEQVHTGAAEGGPEQRQDQVAGEEAAEQRDDPVSPVGAPPPLHVPHERDREAEHRRDRDDDLDD